MSSPKNAGLQFTSVAGEADWFATDLSFHALGTSFLLNGERPVTLPGLGTHNVYNALAVIAAAHRLGVPEEDVLQQLACVPSAVTSDPLPRDRSRSTRATCGSTSPSSRGCAPRPSW